MTDVIAFNPIYLPQNRGHGEARCISLKACSHNIVALMDADDISLPDRFQRQIERFVRNATLSVVGGQISEFSGEEYNITGIRKVPENYECIKEYSKKHCPMNQVSVMFKKADVESAGGYVDWYCEEDYYLWLRMLEKGYNFENVPEILVNVRAGEGMSSRRGGWKYFTSEERLQRYMLKKHMITIGQYLYNVAIRFGGEVVLPNKLRALAFRMLREKADEMDRMISQADALENDEIKKSYPPFSVALCVYGKDNPEWFDAALKSVIVNQTVKPSEVVLVVDGPVPDSINIVIKKYEEICRGGYCSRL